MPLRFTLRFSLVPALRVNLSKGGLVAAVTFAPQISTIASLGHAMAKLTPVNNSKKGLNSSSPPQSRRTQSGQPDPSGPRFYRIGKRNLAPEQGYLNLVLAGRKPTGRDAPQGGNMSALSKQFSLFIASIGAVALATASATAQWNDLLDRGISWIATQPHSPTLDLLGSYFPAWMLCAVAGVVATVVIRQVLVIVGIGEYVIAPLPTYACLALSATWLIWLLMFGH
jgi:hypothetical protein